MTDLDDRCEVQDPWGVAEALGRDVLAIGEDRRRDDRGLTILNRPLFATRGETHLKYLAAVHMAWLISEEA